MDSNYQWQKQQANERIQARMRQAKANRMLKDASPGRDLIFVRAWNWFRKRSPVSDQRERQNAKKAPRLRKQPQP